MKKRILPIIVCILLFLSAGLPVLAKTGSITVLFEHEHQPVEKVSFQIYKAADWDGSNYTWTDQFSSYPVRMEDDPDSDGWKALASTLAAYAARDQLAALTSGGTDRDGKLYFDGLEEGLYLLVGSPAQYNGLLILPQPLLVSIPYRTEDGGTDHEVVVEPKYDYREVAVPFLERRALKVWNDNGNEAGRPSEITVQLLCDGKVTDEQTLSAANNWRYTWEGLDALHDWQLLEKDVPEDYTMQVEQQGITFIVTNTNDNPPPVPPQPPEPHLPQTGLLWWPVPLLAAAGVFTLFGGLFILLYKKEKTDE